MDILAATNTINYFGKSTQVDSIEIKPILLKKGMHMYLINCNAMHAHVLIIYTSIAYAVYFYCTLTHSLTHSFTHSLTFIYKSNAHNSDPLYSTLLYR